MSCDDVLNGLYLGEPNLILRLRCNRLNIVVSADIKLLLHGQLKIQPCHQLLSGWARLKQYEATPLSHLMLPIENTLHLQVKSNEGGFNADNE